MSWNLKFETYFYFSLSPDLEQSIDSSYDILRTVFDSNDFDSVVSMSEPYVEHSIFHSSLKSKLSMLKAGLTLDKVNQYFTQPNLNSIS